MLQLFIEFLPGEGDDHLGAAEYRSGRARPARPVLSSSVEVPCNHSCEAIAPVRLISIHCRRNLNGDSLMRTVDRGREWPYFDVSHCSTLQSGGSAVRPDAASGRTQQLRVTGGFRVPPKRGHNQQERGRLAGEDGGKPGALVAHIPNPPISACRSRINP